MKDGFVNIRWLLRDGKATVILEYDTDISLPFIVGLLAIEQQELMKDIDDL